MLCLRYSNTGKQTLQASQKSNVPQRQGTGNQARLKNMGKNIEERLKAAYSKCVSIPTTVK